MYTITSSAGFGGLISPSGSVNVQEGDSKTYIIQPNAGYITDTVLVDGSNVQIQGISYTFPNVHAAHAISATFKPASPVTNFTATPTNGTAPLAVQFTDTSTNTPTAWSWTFGDDNTSTVQNPAHTYTSSGNFTVSLTATNAGGNTTVTTTNLITVTPPRPVAGFTANTTSGTAPLTVQFTDTSINSPAAWSWTFGDGTMSVEQNPVHTYTSAGNYTVSLTAANAGGSDMTVKTDYITVQSPPPAPAIVSISSGYLDHPGEETTLNLTLNTAPQGLSGYNVNLSMGNTTVAQITSVSFPLWASSMNTTSPLPATRNVMVKASDVNRLVETGAANITLATITVKGLSPGGTSLVLSNANVDDDNGYDIPHTLANGNLTVGYP
jgi:PKD repeat protein